MATLPRYIVPGRVYSISTRCVARSFRLLPTPDVQQSFLFLLALTLKKYPGIRLHEFEVMSNHYHLALTDTLGELPNFMRDLNSRLTIQLNAIHGERGKCFETYHAVELLDDASILATVVYILANPCASNLVGRSREWPGASSVGMHYGKRVRVERPAVGRWGRTSAAKAKNGKRGTYDRPADLPASIDLVITPPPIAGSQQPARLRARIMARLARKERQLTRARKAAGRTVLGAKRAASVNHWDTPKTLEERFKHKPVAAGSRTLLASVLALRREFLDAYYVVREKFRSGKRDVCWPYGTWMMVQRFKCPAAIAT